MRRILDVAGQFCPNRQAADNPTAEERQGEGGKYPFPLSPAHIPQPEVPLHVVNR